MPKFDFSIKERRATKNNNNEGQEKHLVCPYMTKQRPYPL